jgi:hypothetical protein
MFQSMNPDLGIHRVYVYYDVPEQVFQDLCAAENPDDFHHAHIKPLEDSEVTGMPMSLF